jgi:hypothetical protein
MKEEPVTLPVYPRKLKIFLGISIPIVILVCLYFLWHSISSGPRRLAMLTFLEMALDNYEAEHKHLPPAFIPDDNGKPMHSWRVLLLPKFEDYSLYQQYDFKEPWNGPHNKKLVDDIPVEYYCDFIKHAKGKTNYIAVVGPDTIWPGSKAFWKNEKNRKWHETILLLEVNGSDIDWTEPRDLTVEEAIAYIQGRDSSPWKRPPQVYALLASGKRINIPATATTEVLEALFSIDESKVIPYNKDWDIDFEYSSKNVLENSRK